MLPILISPEVQRFIAQHENDDETQLVLRHQTLFGLPARIIASQIAARKKAVKKLPTYYNAPGIVYPPPINLEQSSSEQTAAFKASLVQDLFPDTKNLTIADLTGGFGVDTFFFSKICKTVHYVEPDLSLLETARHNHKQLNAGNIVYHNATAENFLDTTTASFDIVFIDPSRRLETRKKVLTLQESKPDVTLLQNSIFNRTTVLLIKTSPLLDIQAALNVLQFVKKVTVVSVDNECKEVLFLCERNFVNEPVVEAVNIERADTRVFSFRYSEERNAAVSFSDPLLYLYEPHASLMKAGAFKTVASRFSLRKLHPNTHLYTSETLIPDFPGRIFKVEGTIKPEPRSVQKFFADGKANVTIRNYPLTVEQLKKRTGLKDGGDRYAIGCTGISGKLLIAASRIS